MTNGHIHAGSGITPGGRYDRFLCYLRAHPGATTREIDNATGLCAISALVSEIRAIWKKQGNPSDIDCRFVGMTESGGRIYRYWLIENKQDAAPVARQETQSAGAADGNHAVPAAVNGKKEVWILKMDGWKESKGIEAEIALAEKLGLPVKYIEA
jgi:hypothetical protein